MSKLEHAAIRIVTTDGVVEYAFVRDSNEALMFQCTELSPKRLGQNAANSNLAEKIQNLLSEEYP